MSTLEEEMDKLEDGAKPEPCVLNFGNEEGTEIDIPVDKRGMATFEAYLNIGLGRYNFGNVSFDSHYRNPDDRDDDDDMFLYKTLGKVKFKVNMNQCETNVDIRGELIQSTKNKIDAAKARHHMELKELQDKLNRLLAIEHKVEDDEAE